MREVSTRIIEDSALDASFWASFHERRRVEDAGDEAVLTIEQTDR